MVRRVACLLLVNFCSSEVQSQTIPSEMEACAPVCGEVLSNGVSTCCEQGFVFERISGRVTYGPLMNVGSIEVSIQADRVTPDEQFPLYVEVRPNQTSVCTFLPGLVVWTTYGSPSTCNPDSLWTTSPRIELSRYFDINRPYLLQLTGFLTYIPPTTYLASPFIRCVRVRAFPTSTEQATWTRIKGLYR